MTLPAHAPEQAAQITRPPLKEEESLQNPPDPKEPKALVSAEVRQAQERNEAYLEERRLIITALEELETVRSGRAEFGPAASSEKAIATGISVAAVRSDLEAWVQSREAQELLAGDPKAKALFGDQKISLIGDDQLFSTNYDEKLQYVVEKFQAWSNNKQWTQSSSDQSTHITANGIVDSRTLERIEENVHRQHPEREAGILVRAEDAQLNDVRLNRTLIGSSRYMIQTGTAVEQVQADLQAWLEDPRNAEFVKTHGLEQANLRNADGSFSGQYDTATKAVVMAFQSWAKQNIGGISAVDGIVGPRTLRSLDQYHGRPVMDEEAFMHVLNNNVRRQSREIAGELLGPVKLSADEREAVDTLYKSLMQPETGKISATLPEDSLYRFIRTRAGGGSSSAYGPVQITVTLVKDYEKKGIFDNGSPELKQYVDRFIDQGRAFLNSSNGNQTFGLGAAGMLGRKAEDRELYEEMAKTLIGAEYQRAKLHGGSDEQVLTRFIRYWRGVSENQDRQYYAQVKRGVQNSIT